MDIKIIQKKYNLLFFYVFCLLIVFIPVKLIKAAPQSVLTEEQAIAAYIYNFAKFVQWPESAFSDLKAPLNICVAGSESLYRALESLKGQTIQGRALVISKYSSTKTSDNYHILFIGKEHKKEVWGKIENCIIPSVLTIADFESFVSQGGIIELIRQEDRIRFAVNISSARKAGLSLSSQLLKLSVFIKENK